MNRKSLLLLPAALLGSVAMAETVTPEQALDKALGFFQQPARARGQQAAQSLTLAHTAQADGETFFYVFNNPNGGYVIISGDDVAHDVLAYSESGTFDIDNLAPATRWWLSQYQGQIHHAISAERQGMTMQRAEAADEAWPEVLPLLGGIEWNQSAPYNVYLPGNSEMAEDVMEQYVTGCVATATAQVMRYWKYPERGMAKHSYRYNGMELEADFSKSEYKWDLMPEKYDPSYSGTPEENAVAQLMSDVGIALNMSYGQNFIGGSAAPSFSVPYALCAYFGYSRKMEYVPRDQVAEMLPEGMWEEIVYSELAAGRPVIYSGSDPQGIGGAHCFVCDGYKEGFFHINWGWDGIANSEYYLLTATETTPALAPKDEGIGGNGLGQYGGSQCIIIGIKPDPESEGYVYLTEPMSVPAEATLGPQHYEGKLYNPTSKDAKASIACMLQDENNIFLAKENLIFVQADVIVPAKQEITISLDVPVESIIPGVTYQVHFFVLDITDMDEEEAQVAFPWIMEVEKTHFEGPEYVVVNLAEGITTLCVPFDAKLPEGVEAYTAESITADNEVIMKQAYSIEAGNCYILVSEPMNPFILSGMKTIDGTWAQGPVFKGNMTNKPLYQKDSWYVLQIVDKGIYMEKNEFANPISPYEAIIDGSLSDAKYLYFNFDYTSTGIQQVGEYSNSLRFNLMGQPQHDARGLRIENGRVSFVK